MRRREEVTLSLRGKWKRWKRYLLPHRNGDRASFGLVPYSVGINEDFINYGQWGVIMSLLYTYSYIDSALITYYVYLLLYKCIVCMKYVGDSSGFETTWLMLSPAIAFWNRRGIIIKYSLYDWNRRTKLEWTHYCQKWQIWHCQRNTTSTSTRLVPQTIFVYPPITNRGKWRN